MCKVRPRNPHTVNTRRPAVFTHKGIDLHRHQTRDAGLVLAKVHKAPFHKEQEVLNWQRLWVSWSPRHLGGRKYASCLSFFLECHNLDCEDFLSLSGIVPGP